MQPMLNIALRAARKAGEIIVRASDQLGAIAVDEKRTNDFVTEIDRAAEREIIQQLRRAHPDHAFLAEESGLTGNPDSEYRWVIDPLDGTTNFIRGIPHYAVSVACEYRGQLEHGVIIDPVRSEEFVASRGRGAQLNGRRLRVSPRKDLEGALIGTGIPYKSRAEQHIPQYMKSLQAVTERTAGVRRAGAASLDLAYVAAGRLDAFWEIGLNRWDIAAGVLLIREAGGLVGDFKGDNHFMDSGNIVCGTPKCFKAILQLVQPHLGQLR